LIRIGSGNLLMAAMLKTHQHCAGASDEEPQAIGKSRAGNTTKIYLAVDSMTCQLRLKSPAEKPIIALQHLI
jgi:hypothetical protein